MRSPRIRLVQRLLSWSMKYKLFYRRWNVMDSSSTYPMHRPCSVRLRQRWRVSRNRYRTSSLRLLRSVYRRRLAKGSRTTWRSLTWAVDSRLRSVLYRRDGNLKGLPRRDRLLLTKPRLRPWIFLKQNLSQDI